MKKSDKKGNKYSKEKVSLHLLICTTSGSLKYILNIILKNTFKAVGKPEKEIAQKYRKGL